MSTTVTESSSPGVPRSWKIAFGVAVLMVVLAMVGVGLTTTDRTIAPKYWLCLVPVYGLLCVAVAWVRKRRGAAGLVVLRQVLHWLVIGAAIWLDFYVRGTGEMTGEAAGYNALLLLAIGCLLAGIHLEWLFAIVGVLLAVTLMLAVKAEQYLWLMFIIGTLSVAAMIWLVWLYHRSHTKAGAGQLVTGADGQTGVAGVGRPPAAGP
jgi:hypothetical protein